MVWSNELEKKIKKAEHQYRDIDYFGIKAQKKKKLPKNPYSLKC